MPWGSLVARLPSRNRRRKGSGGRSTRSQEKSKVAVKSLAGTARSSYNKTDCPTLYVNGDKTPYAYILDSGAEITAIPEDILAQIREREFVSIRVLPLQQARECEMADGTPNSCSS